MTFLRVDEYAFVAKYQVIVTVALRLVHILLEHARQSVELLVGVGSLRTRKVCFVAVEDTQVSVVPLASFTMPSDRRAERLPLSICFRLGLGRDLDVTSRRFNPLDLDRFTAVLTLFHLTFVVFLYKRLGRRADHLLRFLQGTCRMLISSHADALTVAGSSHCGIHLALVQLGLRTDAPGRNFVSRQRRLSFHVLEFLKQFYLVRLLLVSELELLILLAQL